MAGRPMAKPAETTPVASAEEQAGGTPAGDTTVSPAGALLADEEKTRVAAAEAADEKAPDPSVSTAKPAVTKRTKEPKHRFEEFDATRPDGQVVHIRRNIDTGEQEVTEK